MSGVPSHITQRGVDRRDVFSSDQDCGTYLRLLRDNLPDAQVHLLAWCLMSNHVHLIAVPEREDSLAMLLRRVQGRYAQYYNTHYGRLGHLWQNRFFACMLGPDHLWTALRYVERNPVRAGMVIAAADYAWSSARAHLSGIDNRGILDMEWWRHASSGLDWLSVLSVDDREAGDQLRSCTYAGRPFGAESFVQKISEQFGRHWVRGRPSKMRERTAIEAEGQLALPLEQ